MGTSPTPTSTLTIAIDTSALTNGNAHRGVGMYTKCLVESLQNRDDLQVLTSRHNLEKKKPLLIHYPYFDLFFSTLPLRRSLPTVVTVHDVIPLLFPQQYRPGKKGKLFFYKQRWALQQVQAIITDSRASKSDIVRTLNIPETKVHVVYLAGNPDLSPVSTEVLAKVKKEYHLPPEYILYVGDINYNKNIPQLIKALGSLPDVVHLVCVGKNFKSQPIPEWQRIETQVAITQVEHRVHFISNLDTDSSHLSAIYQGALAYVQPSLYEGFGLPLLEAMQCQTPVITTRNSSLLEVGGAVSVFADPTAESLAEAVESVRGWSAEDRQMRLEAATLWSQTFSWSKTAADTVEVYQKVLAEYA